MDGADVHVSLSGANADGAAALFQVGIDQGAEIFVARLAVAPEMIEVQENGPGGADGSPDPGTGGAALLHLDQLDRALIVGHDGVKKFRVRDREK